MLTAAVFILLVWFFLSFHSVCFFIRKKMLFTKMAKSSRGPQNRDWILLLVGVPQRNRSKREGGRKSGRERE